MEELKNNQILLEISEDKKTLTVSLGQFASVPFSSCPKEPIQNISNAITSFFEKTGLDNIPEWQSNGCGYDGDGDCFDCI